MNIAREGIVVVIEGLDGSGKKTQAKLAVENVQKAGYLATSVAFPNYGTPQCAAVEHYLDPKRGFKNLFGQDNLTYVKQISSMYAHDRLVTVLEQQEKSGMSLIEMKRRGMNIICDRYTTSNILHQVGNLTNPENINTYIDWVQTLEYKDLRLPKPDLVLFLNVTPDVSINNMKKRYNNDSEKNDILENIEHLTKVYERKDIVIQKCGWKVIECCNENGIMLPEDVIAQDIKRHIYRAIV